MLKTVKGYYTKGRIEPAESLGLKEGAEVEVTVSLAPTGTRAPAPTESTAGSWGALIDCEKFEEEVYESRLLTTRPGVSPWA